MAAPFRPPVRTPGGTRILPPGMQVGGSARVRLHVGHRREAAFRAGSAMFQEDENRQATRVAKSANHRLLGGCPKRGDLHVVNHPGTRGRDNASTGTAQPASLRLAAMGRTSQEPNGGQGLGVLREIAAPGPAIPSSGERRGGAGERPPRRLLRDIADRSPGQITPSKHDEGRTGAGAQKGRRRPPRPPGTGPTRNQRGRSRWEVQHVPRKLAVGLRLANVPPTRRRNSGTAEPANQCRGNVTAGRAVERPAPL